MASLISFTMRCHICSNFVKKASSVLFAFLSSMRGSKRGLKKRKKSKKTHHLYSCGYYLLGTPNGGNGNRVVFGNNSVYRGDSMSLQLRGKAG